MKASNCPSCGANLDLAALKNAQCRYCGTTLRIDPDKMNAIKASDDQAATGSSPDLHGNASGERRRPHPFLYVWVIICFALGVQMLQSNAGIIAIAPFAMGIFGAMQMLRRRNIKPSNSKRKPPAGSDR